MKTVMTKGQVFCLKNFMVYSNSLKIKIDVSYSNGCPDDSMIIDFNKKNNIPEGLMVNLNLKDEKTGLLFIGSSRSGNINRFEISLESIFAPVQNLGLEYAVMSAVDAYNKKEYSTSPLLYDTIEFTENDNGFDVEMTLSGCTSSEKITESEENKQTKEDLIGNIKSDLKMMSYFESTAYVKEVMEKMQKLLSDAENLSETDIMNQLVELEQVLIDMISRRRSDTQKYREHMQTEV
ncbi:MAG: hypothetical protein NC177_12370 [Ruminococcus flavefaciens]|nr:hypothetical protein [Ruminococcus flavefaciens]